MLEAYGKNLILKAIMPEKKGLLFTVQEDKPLHFVVESVGHEIKGIVAGEKLLLTNYGVQSLDHEGEKYFMCSDTCIIAKIK